MIDDQTNRIKRAVADWVQEKHRSNEIVIGLVSLEGIDGEEANRYLVDYAVRVLGHWSVAEVWVDDGVIVNVNDLGDGLPLENDEWPWSSEEV